MAETRRGPLTREGGPGRQKHLFWKGDGTKKCEDIDECKEKTDCNCPECRCKNMWGSFECHCSGDLLYIKEHDTCISKRAQEERSIWVAAWAILTGLTVAAIGAYIIYKYRLRRAQEHSSGTNKKSNSSKWEQIRIPSSVRAIVALNLPNYGSGRNPWGLLKPDYLEKVVYYQDNLHQW